MVRPSIKSFGKVGKKKSKIVINITHKILHHATISIYFFK